MRYNLGYMDKYPIEAVGSSLENNPLLRVIFKDYIDPIKLEDACYKALKVYPLFKTKIEFDKEYYLRTNDNPIILFNAKEEDRPMTFGKTSNWYPWRICYFEKILLFEWQHSVGDGMAAIDFLKNILMAYFDYDLKEKSVNYLLAPGLEPFFDWKEKGVNYKIDPQGYKIKYLPPIKRKYTNDMHCLVCKTEDIVNLAKVCNSSVAPIIALLFSLAIRKHLPKKAKNRNVSCNVVIDLRRVFKYVTSHNCVDFKRITYIDEYDKYNFKAVAQIYKEELDNARIPSNLVRAVSDRIKLFKFYHFIKRRWWVKLSLKLIALFFKHDDCNFTVTYLGKITLPEDIIKEIEFIDCKLWPDFSEITIVANDYNGTFRINIGENLKEKGIVEDFIQLADDLGLHFEQTECNVFRQISFVEK